MTDDAIKKLVIVGGGTAGWMAAASLAQAFEQCPLEITLVESTQIGTVGVGEATIPTIRRFYQRLGMSDREVMKATDATCKLGIEFQDWSALGQSFFHPFGLFGQKVRGLDFHHYWLRLRKAGLANEIGDYSLPVLLAREGKFSMPPERPDSQLALFDWALHLDAAQFAALLKSYALSKGVTHIDGIVDSVDVRTSDGFIDSLLLQDGRRISGELFIDCSGFKGLLIEETLKTGYENWQEWLKCDSAYAAASEPCEEPMPYTVSKAHQAGWQWEIPLRTRTGNGHVYASEYISDDEAASVLVNNMRGEPMSDPRKLSFTPGRRKKAWNKNCIALGLAAGFLEPLESTSIALIETGIEKIKLLFPDRNFKETLTDEFNEMTKLEYERVRDFIILHYKATKREDSPLWAHCRMMEVPSTLKTKMALFRDRGHLLKYRWEIFQDPSWLAIYFGYGIYPELYHPLVDHYELDYLRASLVEINKSLLASAESAPKHNKFIQGLYR